MQDRYVGDRNDFMKYALLRRLCHPNTDDTSFNLGLCWYLTDPAIVDVNNPQADGNHIDYLLDEANWRHNVDAGLFGQLRELLVVDGHIDNAARQIANIQAVGILPENTVFFANQVPQDQEGRAEWHNQSLVTLENVDLVFLDPDNSMSHLYTHPVRGGKWAAPFEVTAFVDDARPVMWISHSRDPRTIHHANTMAQLGEIGPFFCSAYIGNCGFHFLLPAADHPIAARVREFVTEAHENQWGTNRYFDSLGVMINPDPAPDLEPPDEQAVAPPELQDDDTGHWEFREAVIVNDCNLWASRNPWLDTENDQDFAFLIIPEGRIVTVGFTSLEGNQAGLKRRPNQENPEEWRELSAGASNNNQLVYRALVRRIPD